MIIIKENKEKPKEILLGGNLIQGETCYIVERTPRCLAIARGDIIYIVFPLYVDGFRKIINLSKFKETFFMENSDYGLCHVSEVDLEIYYTRK